MNFHFSIKGLLLTIISILNLLIAVPLGYMAYKGWENYADAQEIDERNSGLHYLYNTKKYLSLERAAAMALLSGGGEAEEILITSLENNQARSQKFYAQAQDVLKAHGDPLVLLTIKDSAQAHAKLNDVREKKRTTYRRDLDGDVRRALTDEYYKRINLFIAAVDEIIEVNSRPIILLSSEITRQLRMTRFLWEISDYAGREYALLGRLIAQNSYPDLETREELSHLRGRIRYGLETANKSLSSSRWRDELLPALKEAETHYMMVFDQVKGVFYMPSVPANNDAIYPISVPMWLQMASSAVDSLYGLTDEVLEINARHIEEIKGEAVKAAWFSLAIFFCALAISLYSWFLITRRVIMPVNAMAEALYSEMKGVENVEVGHNQLDEISKLEAVLEVFRRSAFQLSQERDKAQAASIAKSEFLANMSHEIRTPMNVVLGLSNILAKSSPLTDKQQEYIKTLQLSAESLLTLINDLLDFSKIEANNFSLEKVHFNLEKLVEDLAVIKSFKARQKKLSFDVDCRSIKGKEYIGDPTRIRQILVNICGNAIKFTEKGRVKLTLKSFPHPHHGYENIEISVMDTGIGIADNMIEKIFDKFTQADASVVRKYGGTGLGLTITKSLVEMMGGTISVTSTPGKGSEFKVNIPVELYAQQSLFNETQSEKPMYTPDMPHSGRILLVEDYYPNVVVAGTFLEEFGFEYDVAESGSEAVRMYVDTPYDVILMDIQMPGMDGYETTRSIRNYESESGRNAARIIGLTAHASVKDKEQCLEAGMDDYLSKPFTQKQLKDVLENI